LMALQCSAPVALQLDCVHFVGASPQHCYPFCELLL
jgi:hypothetical protein